MAGLQRKYSRMGPDENPLLQLHVGSVCVAKYTEDDSWYRGIILEVLRQQVMVQYIDFGNHEWVSSDRVCLCTT